MLFRGHFCFGKAHDPTLWLRMRKNGTTFLGHALLRFLRTILPISVNHSKLLFEFHISGIWVNKIILSKDAYVMYVCDTIATLH